MKHNLLPVILLFLTGAISGQRFDIQMVVDGRLRESVVVIPSHAPPPGGYPMVVMLHGSGQNGPQFYDISGWKELGEEENFITVFPSALKWCYVDEGVEVFLSRWVNGTVTENACSGPAQNYIDDVKFLKLLVSKIIDTLPVNSSKVFASGFSNGSSMIHKLAMDAGDVFSAVSGTGAGLTVSDSVSNPVKRIPLWLMVGNMEPNYIPPSFDELPFGGDSVLIILENSLHRILGAQALSDSFIKNETEITHTYVFNDSMGVSTTHPFLFTLIKGMIHLYPNGNNFPLNAPRYFWEFFQQVSLVSTGDIIESEKLMEAYPNPSNETIHLKFNNDFTSEPFAIKVFNSYGQLVYQEKNSFNAGFELKKEQIGTGLFIVHVEIGSTSVNRKILFY